MTQPELGITYEEHQVPKAKPVKRRPRRTKLQVSIDKEAEDIAHLIRQVRTAEEQLKTAKAELLKNLKRIA